MENKSVANNALVDHVAGTAVPYRVALIPGIVFVYLAVTFQLTVPRMATQELPYLFLVAVSMFLLSFVHWAAALVAGCIYCLFQTLLLMEHVNNPRPWDGIALTVWPVALLIVVLLIGILLGILFRRSGRKYMAQEKVGDPDLQLREDPEVPADACPVAGGPTSSMRPLPTANTIKKTIAIAMPFIVYVVNIILVFRGSHTLIWFICASLPAGLLYAVWILRLKLSGWSRVIKLHLWLSMIIWMGCLWLNFWFLRINNLLLPLFE